MRDFVNGDVPWGGAYAEDEREFKETVDVGITGVELFQFDILDGVEEVRRGKT
jgi:hypothetical protein